jgi:hypothetical protein
MTAVRRMETSQTGNENGELGGMECHLLSSIQIFGTDHMQASASMAPKDLPQSFWRKEPIYLAVLLKILAQTLSSKLSDLDYHLHCCVKRTSFPIVT